MEHQQLICAYDYASAAFWWFEDYKQFALLYDEVEKRAKGSLNAYELELLSNLWFNLYGSVRHGHLDKTEAKLDVRTGVLTAELERLGKDQDRPSASLQAEALRLLVELMLRLPDVDQVFRQLSNDDGAEGH